MPPKVRVTRENIVNAAVDIVRRQGDKGINAREVASELKCSTQPVFSNFATMDELKAAVIKSADDMCREYIRREVEGGEFPPYKASGMAYIKFAKEERELFKLLYMRNRTVEDTGEEEHVDYEMEEIVKGNTGLSSDEAKLFHLEMWAFVHGIAAMFATGFVDLPEELVSKMLTDAYQGLRRQYGVSDDGSNKN